MAKQLSNENSVSNQEAIERFVIRARRVEAHSLVKSGDIERYETPRITYTVFESGNVNIRYHVCPDEEAVESLAGRLRPFIVRSEKIYLLKVVNAIYEQIPIAGLTEKEAEALESIKNWFIHRHEKKDSERYGIQLISQEDAFSTKLLSDALLAESWIYTDTVHADPKDGKEEGLKLSYSDRYRAASCFFCEFACKVISLLNLVRRLATRNLLEVPDAVWNEAVTYAEAEESDQEQIVSCPVYLAPQSMKLPTDKSLKGVPEINKLTPTLIRQWLHPENTASVIGYDATGKQVYKYLAFCDVKDNSLIFTIDGIGVLTVPLETTVEGVGLADSVSFTPNEAHLSKTDEFRSSFMSPNWIEMECIYQGKAMKIVLQQSGNSEGVTKGKVSEQ
ncbi:hypothetical protein [uncultured Varibaculum sp.]|uniref:hypothetical protein n=1 Tax=uncultured Varibaculum sp. TaxID=413896 RepID=UPI0025936F7C|nr:hypothetical protein [uncultured Varibaculum sp.]